MFSVLFKVNPHSQQWDSYLDYAAMLRPELEDIDGFIDNIRYRSMTRPGWILSLSNWRDEKALVRWRTQARHHDVQTKGREEVFADYHLRVGQGTTVTLINPLPSDTPAPWSDTATATAALGLQADHESLKPPIVGRIAM